MKISHFPPSLFNRWLIVLFVLFNFPFSTAVLTVQDQELSGEVGAGNYSYYHLKPDFSDGRTKTAAVVLLLFPIEGDADLYVSRSNDRPTYVHGENDFQSTTCGVDRVDIMLNAPAGYDDKIRISKTKSRPLTVGVYGHSAHPLSRYLLKVLLFLEDDQLDISSDADEGYMSDEMRTLAAADRLAERVQRVQISDIESWLERYPLPGSSNETNDGSGLGELLKFFAEILLAILSFVLNVLVEILV